MADAARPVRLADLSWMGVADRITGDTRIVVPLGATEEHGYLSLLTDTLFVDRVTTGACERAGVLVAPPLPFGCSAFAVTFPGTISLRAVTMCHVIDDIVDSLYRQGFRRIVFVTGHGGNEVITGVISEAHLDRPQLTVYYRNAWAGMDEWVRSEEQTHDLGRTEHAAWHEEFSFTRVGAVPAARKDFPQSADFPLFPLNARTARDFLDDGVVSGSYSVGEDADAERRLQMCVDELARFLSTLPPQPSEA
jgi:creatinine amidohydrolase